MAGRSGQWRVDVLDKSARRFLQLRARNATTNQEKTRSAKTAVRRDAERAAAIWESDLNQFGPESPLSANLAWFDFTRQYQLEHLRSLAESSEKRANWALREFEKTMHPRTIGEVTAEHLSQFAAKLRARKVAESTIYSLLGQVRAAFAWGVGVGLVDAVPRIPKVQRAKTGSKSKVMKGRPISDSEFELLIKAIPEVVGDDRAAEWEFLLRGLWLSGMRIEEAVLMRWQAIPGRASDCIVPDFSGRRPMFRVPAEGEKGFRDRILPMTPDFAEFISKVPAELRTGFVFKLARKKVKSASPESPSKWWVSRTISQIGEEANVIVDSRGPKFASAHDLRRSFGTRWARLVLPQVLRELMRHESLETTMRFYVQIESETTSDAVFAAFQADRSRNSAETAHEKGDTLGDTDSAEVTKTP
ncbi:MAG: tyrosine-type recombinase/integrase [Planctomycetota bacterium]|nr:tyrosine-type recombinase/integrase [Planctomycetota bacterium]